MTQAIPKLDPDTARWSQNVLFVDMLACCDEADLERKLHEDPDGSESACIRRALRMIDDWEAAGVLEAERSRIGARFEPPDERSLKLIAAYKRLEENASFKRRMRGWDNLFAGLHSPDPAQRQRFEALFTTIKDRALTDPGMPEMLEVLERAKKSPGRRRGSEYDDAAALAHMKALVREGMPVPTAAAEALHLAGGPRAALQTSALDRLETKFRAKMALREK